MQLNGYIDLFLGALINMMFYVVIIKLKFKTETTSKKHVAIFYLILCAVLLSVVNVYNKDTFKILLTIPVVVLGVKKILDININDSIIYTLVATVYLFLGEMLILIVMSSTSLDYEFILNNIFATVLGNLITMLATIPILVILKFERVIKKIPTFFKRGKLLNIALLLMITIGSLTYRNVLNIKDGFEIIVNLTIMIIFISLTYLFIMEMKKADLFSEKYGLLLEYLETYEEELNEKRKIIHEYKNQLIVIAGYAGEENGKLKSYIKEIIKEQRNITDSGMFLDDFNKLPSGLKGLIHYKLSHLDKNFSIVLNIKNNLKRFDEIPTELAKDILKIVGIILDNAIEAASESKEKHISIELKVVKSEFILKLKNSRTLSKNSIDYAHSNISTKGKGRGYGLALAKDIVKDNEKITLRIEPRQKEFAVDLGVKI